jgi:hypothetical protein
MVGRKVAFLSLPYGCAALRYTRVVVRMATRRRHFVMIWARVGCAAAAAAA